jgi:uncharacterized protein HemY
VARTLILLGLVLLAVGLVLAAFPKALSWFGRLPGDIRIQREGFSLFLPLTSMLLLSALLTLVANAVAWLVRRWGA